MGGGYPQGLLSWVVATQTFFYVHPYLGEMIQFDDHMFQMGWFNHQPVSYTVYSTVICYVV